MIVDTELSKQYYQCDIKEHAKKKSMWGGSFEPSDHEEYILVDGCFKPQVIRYADSLNKNFDEILFLISIAFESICCGVNSPSTIVSSTGRLK